MELFPPDPAKKIRVLNDKFVRTQQTLGIRILDPVPGQVLETFRTEGKYVVKGKCLNPPGEMDMSFQGGTPP